MKKEDFVLSLKKVFGDQLLDADLNLTSDGHFRKAYAKVWGEGTVSLTQYWGLYDTEYDQFLLKDFVFKLVEHRLGI